MNNSFEKMSLAYYLRELLYQYECVTIPDFGAFVTRSFPVEIDYSNGVFRPFRRELTFNTLLKSNDGVLAHYMAQKQELSYEGALRLIEKEVIVWKQKLQTQSLSLGNLGEMRLNAVKKIEFLPYGKINYDKDAFGLRMFTRTPLVPVAKKTCFGEGSSQGGQIGGVNFVKEDSMIARGCVLHPASGFGAPHGYICEVKLKAPSAVQEFGSRPSWER